MEQQKNITETADATGLAKLKNSGRFPTCVREVMTSKVVTLLPSNSLHEAIAMMANNSFRHFIVVEADSKLAGVVSDRDLLRSMNHSKDWTTTKIGELMTQNVVTVRPETALSDAVAHILTHRINCLPVVDEKNRMCGIVTSTDLLKAYQQIQKVFE